MHIKTIYYLILLTFLFSCNKNEREYSAQHFRSEAYFNPIHQKQNLRSGKYINTQNSSEIWKKSSFDSIILPYNFNISIDALNLSLSELNKSGKKYYYFMQNGIKVTKEDLIYVNQILQIYTFIEPIDISRYLDIYELTGDNQNGNIKYTGYYTPEYSFTSKNTQDTLIPLVVSKKKSLIKDTLCYVENENILHNIRMQGSAIIVIDDTIKKHISFIRKEKIELKDTIISQLVFNKRRTLKAFGAIGTPLTPKHTIAVDPKYIPLGATLLGIVPKKISKHQNLHEVRLLLSQDTGGGIKGPGHIDLFMGYGAEAKKSATIMHHYGKIYLLLPKHN